MSMEILILRAIYTCGIKYGYRHVMLGNFSNCVNYITQNVFNQALSEDHTGLCYLNVFYKKIKSITQSTY